MSAQSCYNQICNLFELARADYRGTNEYQLLLERKRKAEEACKHLSEQDKQYIEQLVAAIVEAKEQEAEYLYKRGYRDCLDFLAVFHF